jgi:hypothetical protein
MVQRVERTRSTRPRENIEATEEAVVTVMASGVGIEEERRKPLKVSKFVTEPAYVRVSAGVTKSTGNYESLRVDIAVTVPCYTEEIEKVQKRTADMVSEMLDAEVRAYMGEDD